MADDQLISVSGKDLPEVGCYKDPVAVMGAGALASLPQDMKALPMGPYVALVIGALAGPPGTAGTLIDFDRLGIVTMPLVIDLEVAATVIAAMQEWAQSQGFGTALAALVDRELAAIAAARGARS